MTRSSRSSRVPRPSRVVRAALAAATLALVGGVGVVPATTAYADDFGSTKCVGSPRNCVSLGDNRRHTWYWEGKLGNQIPGIDVAIKAAVDDYENKTDVITAKSPRTKSLDVQFTDYNYGLTGILGWVECKPGSKTSGKTPKRRCDRQKLRLNGSYPEEFSTPQRRQSLACHEFGHTLGLRHTTDKTSCMVSPFDPDSFSVTLSKTNIADLNKTY